MYINGLDLQYLYFNYRNVKIAVCVIYYINFDIKIKVFDKKLHFDELCVVLIIITLVNK